MMTEKVIVLKVFESFKLGFCKCGKEIPIKRYRKNLLKIACDSGFRRDIKQQVIAGGTKRQYNRIFRPHHKYADNEGRVMEHRYIMELHLGRYLTSTEVVHHKNKNKKDNRIENLMLFETHSKHVSFEQTIDKSDRRCRDPECPHPERTKKRKDGLEEWYGNKEDGFECFTCHERNKYRNRERSLALKYTNNTRKKVPNNTNHNAVSTYSLGLFGFG